MVLVTPCIFIMFWFSGQSTITKIRKRIDSDAEMNVTKGNVSRYLNWGNFMVYPLGGASGEHAMSLISIPPQSARVFCVIPSMYFHSILHYAYNYPLCTGELATP